MIREAGNRSVRGRSEDGIALIAVLWVLVLLSVIAIAVSFETRSNARIARNMAENAAARAAADAGIQRAVLDLQASAAGRLNRDGTVYAWRFANHAVDISVRDEASKIDLNKAPQELLVALFASAGVTPAKAQSLADAIADYSDADNLTRARGAEANEYRHAGLTWGPKNAPFQAVEELQQVLGMTPELYRWVAPDLSIYSVTGTLPATDDARLTRIVQQAGFSSPSLDSSPKQVFSIRAQAKSANGGVFVREAIVQAGAQTGPWILSWRQRSP